MLKAERAKLKAERSMELNKMKFWPGMITHPWAFGFYFGGYQKAW